MNHCQISVVLPDFKDIPVNLDRAIVEDTDYYKIIELPVHELINQEFIEAFVKKGKSLFVNKEFYFVFTYLFKYS